VVVLLLPKSQTFVLMPSPAGEQQHMLEGAVMVAVNQRSNLQQYMSGSNNLIVVYVMRLSYLFVSICLILPG